VFASELERLFGAHVNTIQGTYDDIVKDINGIPEK
jgi:hypothetical protein